jgi:hypothetical protein
MKAIEELVFKARLRWRGLEYARCLARCWERSIDDVKDRDERILMLEQDLREMSGAGE